MSVNRNEYAWEDIQVILPGTVLPAIGIAAIEYTTKRDHTNVYGKGHKPVSTGRGKTEFSGSITLLQSEFESMQQALIAQGKNLTDLTGNITVAYAPEGGAATVDRLIGVRFLEIPKGGKTGDDHMEVVIPILPIDIEYNI